MWMKGYKEKKWITILLGAILLCGLTFAAASRYGAEAAVQTEQEASESESQVSSGTGEETGETEEKTKDGWFEGKYYKDGAFVTGLQTIGKRKYFFTSSGAPFTGSKKIKGKYMVFGKKGQLLTGKKTRIVRPGDGNAYYVDKKGCAVPGWKYLKNKKKVIYARKSGKLAAGEKVDGIRFTKKGYCKITNQGRAKILARAFIKKHTKSGWSKTKKFRKCWYYIIANNRYIATNRPKKYFRGNWVYRVAVDMLKNDLRGDCNGVACATAAIAKELGYKPYVIRSTAQHCFVKANGRYYDNMYGAKFARKSHWKYKVKEKVRF